jgi:hypothetical protein
LAALDKLRRGPSISGHAPDTAGVPCRSAIIDTELCLAGADGVPDFVGLHLRMRRRQGELVVSRSTVDGVLQVRRMEYTPGHGYYAVGGPELRSGMRAVIDSGE